MYRTKQLGRWAFTYRKPYKRPFYFVFSFGNKMKNTPVIGIWRFSVSRRSN